MRRLVVALIACLALSSSLAIATESERFYTWLESDWEEVLVRSPILATSIGDPRYNARMVDQTTAAWRADNLKFQQRRLTELKGFQRTALSDKERVSYDILKRSIEELIEGERYTAWMQPVTQTFSFHNFLALLGGGNSIQPFRTVKDYDDWYQRLSASLVIFDGMIVNMRTGMDAGVVQPRVLMEKVLPQLEALASANVEQSVFWGPIKAFPESIPAADRERLAAQYRALIRDRVTPAYRRLHSFVRDEYLQKARATVAWSDLPDGRDWYAYLVKVNTTTDLTPDAIHAIGQREVRRNLALMDDVRKSIGFEGDRSSFFKHMRDDPRYYFTRPEDVLDGYRGLQKKINATLPRLFDIAPRADYEVREVEAFRSASAAAAMYQSPSADGSRPGVFYVNALALRRMPTYGMETLSLHEASPGHHFQLSIAREDTALPKFRRFGTSSVAYVEGWALYAETLGKELGLYTDPLQWYGHLSGDQLRAMRLVVDTGLHHKGWTRQEAISYMLENSSMNEGDVVAEVERYIANPGQALGYKIGQLEILRLRREAEAVLGDKFDIRSFHRQVLTTGVVPMSVLNTNIQEWVQRQKAPR
jgi:uncharacterized protein (DUF885 family)